MLKEKSTEQTIRLYYDLYVPESPRKPAPLLIALHGYEGNKESMMAKARMINSTDCVIASVQGPNSFFVRSFGGPPSGQRDERSNAEAENPSAQAKRGGGQKIGFGWMMQYKADETIRLHHETLQSIIGWITREYSIDRDAIFLLGFSQSVSLNYRFAFTHPGVIRGIVAVCGGIPGDWDQDIYKHSATDILIVAGETDEFYPVERTRTFKDALARRAGSVDYQTYTGGHVFHNESLAPINDWLTARF